MNEHVYEDVEGSATYSRHQAAAENHHVHSFQKYQNYPRAPSNSSAYDDNADGQGDYVEPVDPEGAYLKPIDHHRGSTRPPAGQGPTGMNRQNHLGLHSNGRKPMPLPKSQV